MLILTIKNIQFKSAAHHQFKLSVEINTSNYQHRQTEINNYDPKGNIATFCESLSFSCKPGDQSLYLTFFIYKHLSYSQENRQLLAKRIIYLKDLIVSNKMQIQLEKNNDMIIKYDFSFSVQENEMQLSPPCQTKQIDLNKSDQGQMSQHNLSSHSLSPQSDSNLFYSAPDEHDQKNFFDYTHQFFTSVAKQSGGRIDYLNIVNIHTKFILQIAPFVRLLVFLQNILEWKKPSHTILFACACSVVIAYPGVTVGIIWLIFFKQSQKILRSIVKIKNQTKATFLEDLDDYTTNLIFIQNTMNRYNKIYGEIKHVIISEDQTLLIELFQQISGYALILSTGSFLIPFYQVLIGLIWFIILNNNASCRSYILRVKSHLDKVIGYVQKIIYLRKKIVGAIFKSKQDAHVAKHSRVEKTFHLYENQRWWVGKEWCSLLLLGERPAWSDEFGLKELKQFYFFLPNSNWSWENEWEIEVSQSTDENGWQYTADFSTFYRSAKPFTYLRRRKWFRKCYSTSENA